MSGDKLQNGDYLAFKITESGPEAKIYNELNKIVGPFREQNNPQVSGWYAAEWAPSSLQEMYSNATMKNGREKMKDGDFDAAETFFAAAVYFDKKQQLAEPSGDALLAYSQFEEAQGKIGQASEFCKEAILRRQGNDYPDRDDQRKKNPDKKYQDEDFKLPRCDDLAELSRLERKLGHGKQGETLEQMAYAMAKQETSMQVAAKQKEAKAWAEAAADGITAKQWPAPTKFRHVPSASEIHELSEPELFAKTAQGIFMEKAFAKFQADHRPPPPIAIGPYKFQR